MDEPHDPANLRRRWEGDISAVGTTDAALAACIGRPHHGISDHIGPTPADFHEQRMQPVRRRAEITWGNRSLLPATLAAVMTLMAAGCNYQPPAGPNVAPTLPSTPGEIALATKLEASTPGSRAGTTTSLPTPASSRASAATSSTGSPVGSTAGTCTDQAAFVDDVTFRDNTLVLPGAAFVKIWRLRNAGTCTWDTTYAIGFIGGARMEASSPVSLTAAVPPGSSIDLAVDMMAPEEPGTYQGFWKMIDRGGSYFGIGSEADVAFWVKIIVPSLPTATGVATPTTAPTASATPKPTPEVIASGFASLEMEMSIDLDTGELDPPSGADVSLAAPTLEAPAMAPAGGGRMSRYGPPPDPPSPGRCQGLNLTDDPIPLSSLSVQSLVCYRTDEGHLGYFRVDSLDDGVGLDFVTWGP